jgi:hypothetical protein
MQVLTSLTLSFFICRIRTAVYLKLPENNFRVVRVHFQVVVRVDQGDVS